MTGLPMQKINILGNTTEVEGSKILALETTETEATQACVQNRSAKVKGKGGGGTVQHKYDNQSMSLQLQS